MLVRKLVLRGYRVRVLARDAEAVRASLPAAVQFAEGDLADLPACRAAIEGADKVRAQACRKGACARVFYPTPCLCHARGCWI